MKNPGQNSMAFVAPTVSAQRRAWIGGFVYGLTGVRPDLSPVTVLDSQQHPATHGFSQPESAQPESAQPESAQPESSQPDSSQPDSSQRDRDDPAPDQDAVITKAEDHPWHDSDLPIVDRMNLAAGKPIEQRLMAAMAQLDCGSCGYVCQTYSQAIASGQEPNLNLCSPGGKETSRMIKQLLKDSTEANRAQPIPTHLLNESTRPSGWSRHNPFAAKLIESRPLNRAGSAKDTRHIAIDLSGSQLTYNVGDALGVYPTNCPQLASMIIRRLTADPGQPVVLRSGAPTTFAQALLQDGCLRDPSDELLELLIRRSTDSATKRSLTLMLEKGVPEGCDVLDVISAADDCQLSPGELIDALAPITPRLYSIASSMKHVGDEVHLTVGKVSYRRNDRMRKGVASTMLADRVHPGDRIRVFVQPNHAEFTVPQNTAAPMIMIGPGTGIAPFMAFLQERAITAAPGKNWLFFGDQHAATDFLYEQEIQDFFRQDVLTRVDTAFSRDGETKVYVQDRMRQNASEFWQWLKNGAYVFVCGDAARMARDVHQTLVDIVAQQGGMPADDAVAYVKKLSSDGRYVRDVY